MIKVMKKIKSRIFVSYLFVSVFFPTIIIGTFYYYSVTFHKSIANEYLRSVAANKKSHIDTYLESLKGRMRDFSSDGKIIDCLYSISQNDQNCSQESLSDHLIENKIPAINGLVEVSTYDVGGKVIASSNSSIIDEIKSYENTFIFGSKSAHVSGINYSERYQHTILEVSAPIYKKDEFLGVISSKIRVDKLYSILEDRTGLGRTGETYLINNDKILISPSRFDKTLIFNKSFDSRSYQSCFKEEPSSIKIYPDYRGIKVLGSQIYSSEMKWCLLNEVDNSEILEPLTTFFNLSVGFGLLSILLTIVMYKSLVKEK